MQFRLIGLAQNYFLKHLNRNVLTAELIIFDRQIEPLNVNFYDQENNFIHRFYNWHVLACISPGRYFTTEYETR